MPLINSEIEPDLKWAKNCVISEISTIPRIPGNQDATPPVQEVPAIQETGGTFKINKAKLYVPFVTLSINDNIKSIEDIT